MTEGSKAGATCQHMRSTEGRRKRLTEGSLRVAIPITTVVVVSAVIPVVVITTVVVVVVVVPVVIPIVVVIPVVVTSGPIVLDKRVGSAIGR